MKNRMLALAVMVLFISVSGCGSGGGGSNGNGTESTFTISGTVSAPTEAGASLMRQEKGFFASLSRLFISVANAFGFSALGGAHVNVCTIQDNVMQPLPAHPSVIADSTGTFSISVNQSDVPSNRQMWVCASNDEGTFDVLAGIGDQLPEDLDEVTTVAVNPNTNTTIITRFQCSQPVLLYSPGNCQPASAPEIVNLETALDTYWSDNPLVTPDLTDFSTVFGNTDFQDAIAPQFTEWLSDVPDTSFSEIVTGATDFVNPTIPLGLAGGLSGGWSGTCSDGEGGSESVSGTFSVSISGSGAITGTISGDDAGSISGTTSGTGVFSAAGGSAGTASWTGTISRSGANLSGSGSWTDGVCSGGWSGSGAATI